jgi:hypothetical protein
MHSLLDGLDDSLSNGRPHTQSPSIGVSISTPDRRHACDLCGVVTSDLEHSLELWVQAAYRSLAVRPRRIVQLDRGWLSIDVANALQEAQMMFTPFDDCFDRAARLALVLYMQTNAPKEVRFTLGLLSIQWSASRHVWNRNDRFPEYPFTLAWFRLFNTTEKLGSHLRESYLC